MAENLGEKRCQVYGEKEDTAFHISSRPNVQSSWRRNTLPQHPLLSQSPPFFPAQRRCRRCRKDSRQEGREIVRGRGRREGTRIGRQVSLALVQGAWHSEPDPLKFNFQIRPRRNRPTSAGAEAPGVSHPDGVLEMKRPDCRGYCQRNAAFSTVADTPTVKSRFRCDCSIHFAGKAIFTRVNFHSPTRATLGQLLSSSH